VILSWNPVPGAVRYRVQFGTDSLFTRTLVDDSLLAGAGRAVGPLDRSTRYFWRVRAKTADGISTGAFARAQSFVTIPFAPAATSLVSPADGTTDLPRASLLRWRAAVHASSYGLQIALDSLFLSPVVDDTTIIDTVYHTDALAGLTRFYWRIRAINAGGSSPYTPRFVFSTMIGTPVAEKTKRGVYGHSPLCFFHHDRHTGRRLSGSPGNQYTHCPQADLDTRSFCCDIPGPAVGRLCVQVFRPG
jgi:hypothetical protein